MSQHLDHNFRKSRSIADLTGVFIWESSTVVISGNHLDLGTPPGRAVTGVVLMEEWQCGLAKLLLG